MTFTLPSELSEWLHENHISPQNYLITPFHLVQLRVIQEVVALIVFVGFLSLAYPDFKWNANHLMALACLIGAVYFAFR